MLCKNKVFYSHSDHFYKWTFQNSSLGEEASWKTDSIYEKCVIEIEKLKNKFGNYSTHLFFNHLKMNRCISKTLAYENDNFVQE